jgi:hypothetical protein
MEEFEALVAANRKLQAALEAVYEGHMSVPLDDGEIDF